MLAPVERGSARRAACAAMIHQRKLIGQKLGFRECPAPEWDMLLELYIAHCDSRTVYVWALCDFSNIPKTTAAGRLDKMEALGLIIQQHDERDRRRQWVAFTPKTIAAMHELMDSFAGLGSLVKS